MAQGRYYFIISLLSVCLISACSSAGRKATCYACPSQKQEWDEFSFDKLEGNWRGSQELYINELNGKERFRKTESTEISFLQGERFLKAYKVDSCGEFPQKSVVLLQSLWKDRQAKNGEQSFEVFGKYKEDYVSYGRVSVQKLNAKTMCRYRQLGSAIHKNRLALPAANYSQRMTKNGRVLASGATTEVEVDFEFLNFNEEMPTQNFHKGSRAPASAKADDPPLLFRFVKVTRTIKGPYAQGKWQGTEEKIFRLWRVD